MVQFSLVGYGFETIFELVFGQPIGMAQMVLLRLGLALLRL